MLRVIIFTSYTSTLDGSVLTIKQILCFYKFVSLSLETSSVMSPHFFICTWPPSDDLVLFIFNIFLNIPTTARYFFNFFFQIFFIGYIHSYKCILNF